MLRLALSVVLLSMLAMGCDDSKRYPTAPAPKTLKIAPMAAMPATDPDEDDELDEDDDEGPKRRRNPSTGAGGSTTPVTLGGGGGPAWEVGNGRHRAQPSQQGTINGHPQGPRAEVFNAVVNNAFSSALGCFAQATTDQTMAFRVRMTVGNEGVVEESRVVEGPPIPKVRSCLEGVVKRLTFPAFQGPKVTQTVPFAAVHMGGSGQVR